MINFQKEKFCNIFGLDVYCSCLKGLWRNFRLPPDFKKRYMPDSQQYLFGLYRIKNVEKKWIFSASFNVSQLLKLTLWRTAFEYDQFSERKITNFILACKFLNGGTLKIASIILFKKCKMYFIVKINRIISKTPFFRESKF